MSDINKVLIIGCPGSGKSTMAKKVAEITKWPLLHLDVIYHIDNYHQISKEELQSKISDFIKGKSNFIIDGNYSATLPMRMEMADTIVMFDLDTDTCMRNVLNRIASNQPRDDIAPGFDNTIYHQDFIDYVKDFREERLPYIEELISEFPGTIIRINSYEDADDFIEFLRKNIA